MNATTSSALETPGLSQAYYSFRAAHPRSPSAPHRAFTLIELLVVIAILAGFTLKSDEPFAFTAPGLLGSKFSEV